MEKPKPKRMAAIIKAHADTKLIEMDIHPSILPQLGEFGHVSLYLKPRVHLWVSALYDFNEVLKYLQETYCKEPEFKIWDLTYTEPPAT